MHTEQQTLHSTHYTRYQTLHTKQQMPHTKHYLLVYSHVHSCVVMQTLIYFQYRASKLHMSALCKLQCTIAHTRIHFKHTLKFKALCTIRHKDFIACIPCLCGPGKDTKQEKVLPVFSDCVRSSSGSWVKCNKQLLAWVDQAAQMC